MFDIYDLSVFFVCLLLLFYWWHISGQKSHALAKARQHCKDSGHQLLDQTLVFLKHHIEKDARGRRHLCRIYEFDFASDGEVRHKGQIVLANFIVIRIVLEHEYLEVTEF